MRGFIALALMLLSSAVSGAELLKDINTTIVPVSSNPRYLGAAGSSAIFVAGNGSTVANLGLWASDGSISGTRLILQDAQTLFFNPRGLISLGPRTLWIANGPTSLQALWVTDGTTAGTFKVADLDARSHSVVGELPNGVAVFGVLTAAGGTDVWRTDGTVAGTWRLAQFGSPVSQELPQGAVLGNRVYFAATTASGAELWVTDGSNVPANTHLEIDLEPGPGSSSPFQITAVGNNLYFTAILNGSGIPQLWTRDAGGNFRQLATVHSSVLCATDDVLIFHSLGQPWRSDGTPAGTHTLLDPQQQRFDSIGPCVSAADRVFFAATVAGSNTSLWQSDGSVAGTTQLSPGTALTVPTPLFWTGSHLFFSAHESVHGSELWITDGTAAGTHLVMDAFPGNAGGSQSFIQAAGSHIFVVATAFSYQFPNDLLKEVWRTDPDGSDPVRLTRNVSVESYGNDYPFALLANNRLFFVSRDPVRGAEPSASDGTASGTVILRDIAPQIRNLDSHPYEFQTLGNSALFWATDGVAGRELWRTDGTAAGTTMLMDIQQGAESSNGMFLGVFDGIAYFRAKDAGRGYELWRTDGTSAGTGPVFDIEPGTGDGADYSCTRMLKLGSFLYFSARTSTAGVELWRTDGTAAGTQLVTEIVLGTGGGSPCPLAVVGEHLYFVASDTRGRELWSTDGTAAGTRLIADLAPGAAGSNVSMPAEYQGELVFAAGLTGFAPTSPPRQLWRTDGGAPRLLIDLAQAGGGAVAWVRTLEDAVYFGVAGGSSPGLYRWSGGTDTVRQFATGIRPTVWDSPSRVGSRLVFLASTDLEGGEMFATDGTSSGTVAITSFSAAGESKVGQGTLLEQTTYFTVFSPDGALQLARSDGTSAGTEVLSNFVGDTHGFYAEPAIAGGHVVFGASDGVNDIGYELFVHANRMPQAQDDSASVVASQSVVIAVLSNDSDADGRVIASSVRIVSQPSNGTVRVDASGSATYVAAADFVGTDTFRYVVADHAGAQSAPATVRIAVSAPPPSPVQDPPLAQPAPGSGTQNPPAPPAVGSGGDTVTVIGTGGGSRGGGGSFEIFAVCALGMLLAARRRRRCASREPSKA